MADLTSADDQIPDEEISEEEEASGVWDVHRSNDIVPEHYSDSDSDHNGRGPTAGEQELATKMLQIQSKRFYLDVKQNWRGRFIKMAEVGAGGRKSRLLMSMSAAAEFRDLLQEFSEFYANLGPPTPGTLPEDGQLKSEVMVKENRRYYLDLKENNRGRFLRVTQTVFRGGRSLIVMPAEGIPQFLEMFSKLVHTYSTPEDEQAYAIARQNDNGFQGELPEGKQFRAENKMFYFDIGQNNRGVFMRISEVKNNFRTAITIPERSWPKFRDYFAEICAKMDEGKPQPPEGAGGDRPPVAGASQ